MTEGWADVVGMMNWLWAKQVKWWNRHLFENTYDGIIGLSQGSAMTALLLSLLTEPLINTSPYPQLTLFPDHPSRTSIKFAVMCSGFVSDGQAHQALYRYLPTGLRTLHTVDRRDGVVRHERTRELERMFARGGKSEIYEHNEGECTNDSSYFQAASLNGWKSSAL